MSSQWVAFLVVAAMLPGEAAPAGSSQPSMESPLSVSREPSEGYELRDAVRSAFRQWAKPSDDDAPQAAREFLTLYQDLQADTQLARSQRETLRTQVRNRLIQLSEQISSRIARQRRLAKVERPKSVARPPDKAAPLAQQMGGLGGVGRGGANAGAAFGGGGVSRQATLPDAGQDLVDLIQRVISPKSWDVHGGPGSIYYWQPGHALIIRQTSEVHDQIGDMLEQMQRMER